MSVEKSGQIMGFKSMDFSKFLSSVLMEYLQFCLNFLCTVVNKDTKDMKLSEVYQRMVQK